MFTMMHPDDPSIPPSSRLLRQNEDLTTVDAESGEVMGEAPTSASFMRTENQSVPSGTQCSSTKSSTNKAIRDLSSYDPLSPSLPRPPARSSLLDAHEEFEVDDLEESWLPRETTSTVPGAAGFLEMEQEPPRSPDRALEHPPPSDISSPTAYLSEYEPIKTTSGLLLTHRRTPAEATRVSNSSTSHLHYHPEPEDVGDSGKKRQGPSNLFGSPTLKRALDRERLEVENPWSAHHSGSTQPRLWQQGQRLLSFVRLWVLLSALIVLIGTSVIVRHVRHERSASLEANNHEGTVAVRQDVDNVQLLPFRQDTSFAGQAVNDGPIILLPLPTVAAGGGGVVLPQQQIQPLPQRFQRGPEIGRLLSLQPPQHQFPLSPEGGRNLAITPELWDEFESWMTRHGKIYRSHQEKEKRFQIWSENHHRTVEKNERHGPCKMTKQPVFGSNHFKDLSGEEFKAQYLTGYTGPTADNEPPNRSSGVLGPHIVATRHPDVHRRIQEHHRRKQRQSDASPARKGMMKTDCSWYDVSCLLTYVFETYLYGLGKTMEPGYDSDSYPTAIDWRDLGAVTEVHSQGNCGACWAITAIETVESAVFISTGNLMDLSETEVIVCAEDCEMCAGGWPQDAFEYVMEHGGVPLESDCAYDGDFLLALSDFKAGESDEIDEETAQAYISSTCPNGGGSGSNSGDGGSGNNYARYGNIKGYGYATSKCVCYNDGTGCDCDSQNEGVAVRNVATYGPAVVCFDASVWQDYAGGIISSDSGCSSHFMDVNHCAQVVGYAYDSDEEEEAQNSSKSGGSGSGDGGSNDDGTRSGYWIVRNQWSSYWGMNGYAYVAMGKNTCGILNDMLVAYS